MMYLYTFYANSQMLTAAIVDAERYANDAITAMIEKSFMAEDSSTESFKIINISSETLHANGEFHYILKYLIER